MRLLGGVPRQPRHFKNPWGSLCTFEGRGDVLEQGGGGGERTFSSLGQAVSTAGSTGPVVSVPRLHPATWRGSSHGEHMGVAAFQ